MISYSCLLVLAGVFQVITSQGPPRFPPGRGPPGFENIPEKCRGPPQGVEHPEQCCQIEPMYTEEDFAGCGFKKGGQEDFQEKRGPPDCSKFICLMRLKNLADDNGQLDLEAVANYINGWATEGWEAPAKKATSVCIQDGKVPGPPHFCEAMRLMHCMGAVLFGNCPEKNWQQTDNCKALKDHMDECKAPFE